MSHSGTVSAGTILVIDDDVEIRRLVFKTLEPAGYRVKVADWRGDIIQLVFSSRSILLMIGMETFNMSHFKIVRKLRKWSTVPVILLSYPTGDGVPGLSPAGVSDHIIKPFSHAELLTSVHSVLKVYNTTDQGTKYEAESVTIDFERRMVSKKGKTVNLTPTEFSLLTLLVHNAGKLITHDSILRQIRGPWVEQDTTYSRVYMGRLRKKLEDDPNHPQMFQTESGRGYKFVAKTALESRTE
jgi:two-component system, OmpR family, KDP operon response regulator KdpE